MSSYKNLEALVEKYVHKYQALSLVLESVQQERDEYRDLYSSSQEKLEAAERERDELEGKVKKFESYRSIKSKLFTAVLDRAKNAEAELARRDAAVGEPVAWQYRYNDGKVGDWRTVDSESECNHSPCYERRAIYTVAPSAVVPPAMTYAEALKVSDWKNDQASIWVEGANWMRQQCLELGAQQQKPVICPPVQYLSKYAADDGHCTAGKLVPNKRTELRDAEWREALEAAGVKWEVKK